MDFSVDKARSLLDAGVSEAQDLIRDPSKVDDAFAKAAELL